MLPNGIKIVPMQVVPQRINENIKDFLLPKYFIETQAKVYPGISIKHIRAKFKYLLPLILVEFNDKP